MHILLIVVNVVLKGLFIVGEVGALLVLYLFITHQHQRAAFQHGMSKVDGDVRFLILPIPYFVVMIILYSILSALS